MSLLQTTTSLCKECLSSVPAELQEESGAVWLYKVCPKHGRQSALVSSNSAWYARISNQKATLVDPVAPTKPVAQGCPFDCGPCDAHEQRLQLPIVPITSACNLDCPICYTHNKNSSAYHMSEAELRAILGHLKRLEPEQRIINLTGGEPTEHPDFLRLVELCHEAGIHRVTVSTHGLRFLKDEHLLESLARLDARVILSFDSFKPEVNKAMLGGQLLQAKLKVLALLEKHQVKTTLLPVLGRGLNDDELGNFVELALNRDFIQSVEFHPLTFTGQGGKSFDRSARYTTYDALVDLELSSQGALKVTDFVAAPAAHPLCYLTCYLLRLADGRWLPFSRFMSEHELRGLFSNGLYLEPSPEAERTLSNAITGLWAGSIACASAEPVLDALGSLVRNLFDPELDERERLRVAERYTKAIYIHSHMDEETFDSDRIRQCPVSIVTPEGRTIPSCSYNVLYRNCDARFSARPAPPLLTLGRGRR